MTVPKSFPLTPRSLGAWLGEKGPNEVVGIGGTASACPLARCMKETLGLHEVLVGVGLVRFENGYEYALPGWAHDFASMVDAWSGIRRAEGYCEGSVTAEECRVFLGHIVASDLGERIRRRVWEPMPEGVPAPEEEPLPSRREDAPAEAPSETPDRELVPA
ncbi:MAG: hypothetical protein M3P49_02170 [Actinomycetota bacterium]|nr:hypothetical protein [Actinomycetota bacterium]